MPLSNWSKQELKQCLFGMALPTLLCSWLLNHALIYHLLTKLHSVPKSKKDGANQKKQEGIVSFVLISSRSQWKKASAKMLNATTRQLQLGAWRHCENFKEVSFMKILLPLQRFWPQKVVQLLLNVFILATLPTVPLKLDASNFNGSLNIKVMTSIKARQQAIKVGSLHGKQGRNFPLRHFQSNLS